LVSYIKYFSSFGRKIARLIKLEKPQNIPFEAAATLKREVQSNLLSDTTKVKTYVTTQKLRVTENKGERQTQYVTTSFATFATVDKNGSTTDNTGSYRAYATIVWTDNSSGIKLTSVSGGWTRLDSAVSISNKKVNFGQTGAGCSTSCNVYKSPTTNSFSYSAPSTWPYIADDRLSTFGTCNINERKFQLDD
jgi:hypothetical protein